MRSGKRGIIGVDIEGVRELCAAHKIEWTLHGAKRLLQRGIPAGDIDAAIMSGEVIEDYPEDYPFPSCLLLGKALTGNTLHVVCAIGDDKLWIITAYKPTPTDWEPDLKTRRRRI